MAVAGPAQAAVVVRRRGLHVGAAHGLDDHRGDVALLGQAVVDIVGAAQLAVAGTAEDAVPGVAGRHMLGPGQQRADAAAKRRLAADRDRIERRAVERVPHREGLVAAGGQPGKLERDADRGAAAGGQQQARAGHRRGLAQTARQLDRRPVGVAARAERQGRQRLAHRRQHRRVAVADLVHAVAVKVEDAPPGGVGQPRALRALQRIQAGRRQRRVQEPAGVLGEQLAGGGVEVRGLPGLPARAEVDVALAAIGLRAHRGPRPVRRR